MKFVHLTPQPNIARIKKSGIHQGSGRRGRGVYAVPLMLFQCVSLTDDDRIIKGDQRSSMTLWHWLSNLRHRHRNLAAVIFETTAVHWPANIYIELKSSIGTNWINNVSGNLRVVDAELDFVRNSHQQGFCADLRLTVGNASTVGSVLHAVQAAGLTTWNRYDETIEFVFPSNVRPSLIESVIPLYRTNSRFKEDRQIHIQCD